MNSLLPSAVLLFFTITSLTSQARGETLSPVVISEVMTSNKTVFADETGAFTDWIELYNSGDAEVDLTGYGLSDGPAKPLRWVFPACAIPPRGYLVVLASRRDTTATGSFPRKVILQGDDWKFRAFSSDPPANWLSPDFDDSGWESGPSGFGYDDGDDATIIPSSAISVHMRKRFFIPDAQAVTGLKFQLDYDDGFAVYLNGVEVSRVGLGIKGTPVKFNDYATFHTEALLYQGKEAYSFPIKAFPSILRTGENVFAIEGHNSENSSDMSFIPLLTVTEAKASIHTDFRISAGETLALSEPGGAIINSVTTVETPSDVSQGRSPDTGAWLCFTAPTPGTPNAPNGNLGIAKSPEFTPEGGFQTQAASVSLVSATPGATVYYTTDGTDPALSSTRYTGLITVNKTTVLKARAFAENYIPSEIITHTYLINEKITLPVISISTDPTNFWGNTGIYDHYGADWERPAHIEFFETGGALAFSQDTGVKIHGASSASFPQKSFQVFAHAQFGPGKIRYKVFPDLPFTEYDALVLRNSGHDWGLTMFRDALISSLAGGTDMDTWAYRPAIVFINGAYWGLYNIREKLNDKYIAQHHPEANPDSLDIMEYVVQHNLVAGDRVHFDAMTAYMQSHNLSVPEYYEQVKKLMDVDQFIDYQVDEIFSDNGDWPGNNVKFWRPKTPDGKWRWILYDTDCGFGHPVYGPSTPDHNKLILATHPNKDGWGNYGPWSTLIIRNLLKNKEFRNQFINRFADRMNTGLLPDSLLARIEVMQSAIRPEMSRHFTRWGGSVSAWDAQVNILRDFARRRASFMRDHIIQYFGLGQNIRITLNTEPGESGAITFNTSPIARFPWQGYYFSGVPVRATAHPATGYRFVRWSGASGIDSASVELSPDTACALTAQFEKMPFTDSPVIINEINYKSDAGFDPSDWVELYNRSGSPVDLSGWRFLGVSETSSFIFPAGTRLEPRGYLVLCRDTQAFSALFPDVKYIMGNVQFGFSGGGDFLRILDSTAAVVDSLTYGDNPPWPEGPDGKGPTLSLRDPSLDNTLPGSWEASSGHGTPGAPNAVTTGVNDAADIPARFTVEQNFPNPFNPSTRIRFGLTEESPVTVEVFNVLGQKVATPFRGRLGSGFHTLPFRAEGLTSGVYFFLVKAGTSREVRRMLLVR